MKTPEELAREWLRGDGRLDPMAARTAASLADLLRQRDAEHEVECREAIGRALLRYQGTPAERLSRLQQEREGTP